VGGAPRGTANDLILQPPVAAGTRCKIAARADDAIEQGPACRNVRRYPQPSERTILPLFARIRHDHDDLADVTTAIWPERMFM
jgi:hypothetical protein